MTEGCCLGFYYSPTKKRSLSEIAQLCRTDIRYMWLSNEERPSHMAFQRLTEHLKTTIDEVFFDINEALIGTMSINTDIQFIDGNKIEANAHKHSFVYRKRITNARISLYEKIALCITEINKEFGYSYKIKDEYCSQELGYIAQYLVDVMTFLNIQIKYGKGQRKSVFQKFYDEILGYYIKLSEYEYWLDVMKNHNSCSKNRS